MYANLFQLRNYVEAHVTEIKQLRDARKGTAPFVGKLLKEVMGISSAHTRNISDFKSLTALL